ncbi:MAG: RHS repeat domain-containing protein [Candidatus Promineifilaceae bacterium]
MPSQRLCVNAYREIEGRTSLNLPDRSELIGADRYLGADPQDSSSPVAVEQRGYLYDPIGNRAQATSAGVQTGYTTNALNQYSAVTGPDAFTPSYDADGNLKNAADGTTYTYNAENRLIGAQPETPAEGDTRIEFTYDYMGRRVQKVVYSYSSGAWTPQKEIRFVYDGWNLIKETTTPDGGSAVDKYYVWGLDLSQSLQGAGGVGGLLATIDGSLTYQYLYDANGNVGQLVDAADGSIAARYEYDPYGNLTDLGGAYADANAYRFSTKYFDDEVELYYYGYRYYSADLGRWLNRDPLEGIDGANLYSFAGNDATNFIDYLGGLRIPGITPLARKLWREVIQHVLVPRRWNVAAFFLNHSLQDNPSDLHFGKNHFVTVAIRNSRDYKQKIKKIVHNQKVGYQGYVKSDSIDFQSGYLFAAIHAAYFDYVGYICKSSDSSYKLALDITVSDK